MKWLALILMLTGCATAPAQESPPPTFVRCVWIDGGDLVIGMRQMTECYGYRQMEI